jgi:cytochrome o ubiquinol oxidase subunit II
MGAAGLARRTRAERALNAQSYGDLARPSIKTSPLSYRLDDAGLFDAIVSQKIPPAPGPQTGATSRSAAAGAP